MTSPTSGSSPLILGRSTDARTVPLLAIAAALGSGVVWSFGAIAARWADDSDAFQYLVWRSITIVAVVEIVLSWRGRPGATLRAFRSGGLMVAACACLVLASIAFIYAVKTTTPANAAFLSSISPLVAGVLARATLGEPLTLVTMLAIVVASIGLLITFGGDLGAGSIAGNVAALCAAVGFGGYAVSVRADPRRDWSPVLPGYGVMMILICGTIVLFEGKTLLPPAQDIGLAALHGAVFIVVGTTLFNVASRHIPAAAMAVFAQTEMLFVPIWGLLILGERPSTSSVIGGLIILTAVFGKALIDARSARR